MNLDSLFETIDHQLIESQNRPLNPTETIILRGVWQYRTYNQIAIEAGYSPGYFTNIVAPELYQRLSKIVGQRLTKKNCRQLLESHIDKKTIPQTKAIEPNQSKISLNTLDQGRDTLPCYPSGSVPLNSSFYLKPTLLDLVEREIEKPGALIRIKAPREMGKTSLLLRNIDYADRLGYKTVSLNLEQVESKILSNLNLFLRWLCTNVSYQLKLEPKLEEYWNEDLGSTISCTFYFQNYLLESIETPLVLALDEANQIFEHPQVAKDFFPLLRSWYEEAKRLPVWQKLRLLVVHSTEIYVPLELNQSPFNVGLPIQLENFSEEQVQQLAKCYGLDRLHGEEVKQLMAMVGGHPALVHLALYHLSRGEITLPQLLETAPTATGIYHHHLQRHWTTLQKQPELVQALDTVLSATESIALDPVLTYKLSSMGLIKLSGDRATVSCELYRQFLRKKKE